MTGRWRLFPKYALLIITLVGGMLLASGAIGIYFSWRETEANLVALQVEKAQNAATRIEEFIGNIAHQIGWTALPRASADGDALEERRIEYLKLLRQVPAITEVAWIDPRGREQLRISRLAMDVIRGGSDLSGDARFREATGSRIYYGPVYFRKGTEPYMTIARAAGDGGVTAAEVNLKFVWDVVSRIKVGATGLAYVIDATRTLVAHPDISLVLKKSDLSALPQVAELSMPDKAARALAVDVKGAEVFSAHAPIPTLGWTVFVESPRAEALVPLYATLQRTLLVLVAALLISIAASFFLARALVRPLRALQEGAARIGAGDLDHHLDVSTGDEIEGLAEQFNRMSAQLRESYSGLERKVEQRTAELTDALEQQIATSDVLQAISNSVADAAPVFDRILGACERLFGGNQLMAFLVEDNERLALAAIRGPDADRIERARRIFPVPLAGTASEQAIREGRLVTFGDVFNDPGVPEGLSRVARLYGENYSVAVAPMLWEGRAIGSILVGRTELKAFDEKEQRLLRTFADQAVIAIQNARLFNETKEALEQQTATAEVLRVISGSVADSGPVFEKILESCQRLFASTEQGILLTGDDDLIHLAAHHGNARERLLSLFPVARVPGVEATTDERRIVHVKDVLNDPGVADGLRAIAERIGVGTYSQVIAPMMWEGEVIGSLYVIRQPPTGFTDKEIGLLRTFADQAVIAIQNARLFNETREALRKVELRTDELTEALDYQTAISDVLRVISQSPKDVAPVFDAILESASRLFGSPTAAVFRFDGRLVHLAATLNWPDEAIVDARRLYPGPPNPQMMSGRVILSGQVQKEEDALNDPTYDRHTASVGRWRRMVGAPLLKEGQPIGAIVVAWTDPGVTPQRQADLLQTFADQAVIAIENVRLLSETTEALERQTATAEVLQVISSSVAQTQPVFDKILDSCERLFAASGLGIYLVDESGMLHSGGVRATPAANDGAAVDPPGAAGIDLLRAALAEFPRPVAGTATEIAIRRRAVLDFPDVLADPEAPEPLRRVAQASGSFSIAFAPMLWEGRGVGAIQVSRQPPAPFSSKELGLLKTFADQAVIAIQNARLFNEIQAKSRELEMANKHKSEFLANMSHELRTPLNAIIGFSEVLSEEMFGEVNEKQREYLLDIHSSGHHLLTLINDILDLSKIEAGRMELDLASTSLPMLLDNCTTLVRERASRQGLVLALEVEDGLGEWVADVRKLKQVVINLLSNAVKFTPAGGKVTLRARRLERAVEIAVVDTGVGIAKDQQALVFEEFRQAGGDYLRKAEGTGLGLSLARRFVELHGGSMRVESEPGHGSTFSFVLPERSLEAV